MSFKQEEGIIHYRSLKGLSAAAAGAGATGLWRPRSTARGITRAR